MDGRGIRYMAFTSKRIKLYRKWHAYNFNEEDYVITVNYVISDYVISIVDLCVGRGWRLEVQPLPILFFFKLRNKSFLGRFAVYLAHVELFVCSADWVWVQRSTRLSSQSQRQCKIHCQPKSTFGKWGAVLGRRHKKCGWCIVLKHATSIYYYYFLLRKE